MKTTLVIAFGLLSSAHAANTAPEVPPAQSVSTSYNTSIAITLNAGSDTEKSTLKYIKVSNPSNGSVVCNGGASRECTFTPSSGFSGTSTFTYKVNDGDLDSNIATVSVYVSSARSTNQLPASTQEINLGNVEIKEELPKISPPKEIKKWKTKGLESSSVYKMKFHPTNSALLYSATAEIGAMVSEDHGASFRIPKTQFNSFYDFAFDAQNDMLAYAAAGSIQDFPNLKKASVVKGAGGIFKSADRGRSWSRLTPDDNSFNRQYLSVAYDSRNSVIYAGSQEAGIIISKDDGANWTYANDGLPPGNKIIPQIEVDPTNGNVYALLTGDAPTFSNQAQTGIYFLDVANDATNWKLLRGVINTPKDLSINSKFWFFPTAFAVDFNNPGTLWLVDYENHGNRLMTGVWKSINNGASWNRMKQVTQATDIKIDPKNPNTIHVTSYFDQAPGWGNGGMLYSKDAGLSWSKNTEPHLQQNARSLTIDPVDPTMIFYSYSGEGILYGENPAK